MPMYHDRFPRPRGLRLLACVCLGAAVMLPALPAAAQEEQIQSGPASTSPNCQIHMTVANPSPGDQQVPRDLIMSGSAIDLTATSAAQHGGISQIQAFLGNRDEGGTFIGNAAFAEEPSSIPGAWTLIASIPAHLSGGQEMFVYGKSSVSGQEAVISIPIALATQQLVQHAPSNVAQSFCPIVMAPVTPTSPAVALGH